MAVATSLFGATTLIENQIKHFDKTYKSADQDATLKLHHMLKNIYIQSIINGDRDLKIRSLKRLVETSSKLNLDASSYKKELVTLGEIENTVKEKKQVEEFIKVKENKPEKDTVSHDLNKPLNVLHVTPLSQGVKVRLNRPLKKGELKTFKLKSKKYYRYVFDIKATLMGKSKTYNKEGIEEIRVAQFDKKTTRIVFSNPNPLDIDYEKDDKTITIIQKSSSMKIEPKNLQVSTTATAFDPKSKIIVIDAGHGGKDAGAVGYRKYREKNVVLSIALKLGRELKKRGYRIYYTRTKDTYKQLRDRTEYANNKNADLFLSIHANAAPSKSKYESMKGLETFFLSPARSNRSKNVAALENKSDIDEMNYFSKQTFLHFLNREKIIASNKMALDVQQGMLGSIRKKYSVRDGGVREEPVWVLVGAKMPSILIEIGYINNPTEAKIMVNQTYQNLLVKGVANGVDSYFYKNF